MTRTRVAATWVAGWRRVLRAPAIAAAVVGLTLLAVLPFALVMRETLAAHLGASGTSAQVAAGVDFHWWQEFTSQASGLGATFTPRIVGFAATLDPLSTIADARREATAVLALAAAYLGLWTWLLGGILDRYARQRPTHAHGFAAASGGFFWRLLRLALIACALYWWLFAYVHPWLFDVRLAAVTRGLDSERVAFLWRVASYGVFAGLLVTVNLLFDYAKIRLVVEDRRSVMVSLAAAFRFIRRCWRGVVGLYVANTLCFLTLLAAWAVVAPGITTSGARMWLALGMGQAFVTARLLFKLQFLASQTALFQSELAHAHYAAMPPRAWPDSASVEAVSAPGA